MNTKQYQLRLYVLKAIELFVLLVPVFIIVYIDVSYIAQPSYAGGQSLGFSGISDMLKLWKALRDLFYFLYMVVGGVGIVLFESMKQADHKIRNSFLKKFVIGFLLLTFSYAIAGLTIDLGWLSYYSYLKFTGQPLPFR